MTLGPRPDDAGRIRIALNFFRVSAFITGVFLLGLVFMMVTRYGFGLDLEFGGPDGFITLTPREIIETRGTTNLSITILTVHGYLYVLYLACDFWLWRLLRFSFLRFLFIALGGVVPFLSFYFEYQVPKFVRAQLDALPTPAGTDNPVGATP